MVRAQEQLVDDVVVHIVPMRRRHLRSVLKIEAQVYPRPWSLSLFMSEMALRSSRAYYVARIGGVVVGYVGLMVNADDGHVTTLAVDPRWQRRHIGSRLLLVLARQALAKGASSLTLEVRVGNRAAQELYRCFGFRPAGIRKNYYVETNEDALVMWADDVGDAPYARRLDEIEARIPGVTLVERDPGPERPLGAGDTGPERPLGAGDTGPERPLGAGDTGPERPLGAGDTGPERHS